MISLLWPVAVLYLTITLNKSRAIFETFSTAEFVKTSTGSGLPFPWCRSPARRCIRGSWLVRGLCGKSGTSRLFTSTYIRELNRFNFPILNCAKVPESELVLSCERRTGGIGSSAPGIVEREQPLKVRFEKSNDRVRNEDGCESRLERQSSVGSQP